MQFLPDLKITNLISWSLDRVVGFFGLVFCLFGLVWVWDIEGVLIVFDIFNERNCTIAVNIFLILFFTQCIKNFCQHFNL